MRFDSCRAALGGEPFYLEGRHLHEKPDRGKRQKLTDQTVARSLLLRSLQLGLFGKADVVEFHPRKIGDPIPFPIEYKRGKPKRNDGDRVHSAPQALCLEEMLQAAVPAGAIFYGSTRRRLDVPFDIPLRSQTLEAIQHLHELSASRSPRPRSGKKNAITARSAHLCCPEILHGSESASRYLGRSVGLSLVGLPIGLNHEASSQHALCHDRWKLFAQKDNRCWFACNVKQNYACRSTRWAASFASDASASVHRSCRSAAMNQASQFPCSAQPADSSPASADSPREMCSYARSNIARPTIQSNRCASPVQLFSPKL